jgi:hypothetical protein
MTTHTIASISDLRYAVERSAEYREVVRCRLDGIDEGHALTLIRVFAAEVDSVETEHGGAPATDVWGTTLTTGREFRLFLVTAA